MKLKIVPLVLVVPLLIPLFQGCDDDRDERFDGWKEISGPFIVGGKLVYLDPNFSELLILTPDKGSGGVKWNRVPVEKDARIVLAREEASALVLQSPSKGLLRHVDMETMDSVAYQVDSPYDRFTLDESAGIVAAYFSESAQGGDQSIFLNKGEISIIDLKASKGGVRKFVVPTYGGAPLGVDVAPAVKVGKGSRLPVFVRWNSWISLVDAGDPDFTPVSIPLVTADSDTTVYPLPMKFVVDNKLLQAFFLAGGSSDVHQLSVDLEQLAPGGKGVSVNLFPTAWGASDMGIFYESDGGLALMVTCSQAKKAAVVRPALSDVRLYDLQIRPDNLSLFRRVSADSGKEENFALIYDASGSGANYYFVELDQLVQKKIKAFKLFTLPAPVKDVQLLADGEHFLVIHPSGQTTPMSKVALSDGSIISVGGQTSIVRYTFSKDGKTLYSLARKGWQTWLTRFDLAKLTTRSIRLSDYGADFKELAFLESMNLLVASNPITRALILAPGDFQNSTDATVYSAPHFIGLEH